MRQFPLTTASWRFRDATNSGPWRAAVVPGGVHRDLLRHKLIPDPFWASNEAGLQWIEEHDWEYRATFAIPAAMREEAVIELVADGLDTVATVFLNGTRVGRSENMFLGHRWDVKPLLRRGKNELRVRFESAMGYIRRVRPEHQPRESNDPVGRCVVIRKQQCQFGWDWGPRFVTAGIWRDLRLEAWTGTRLESVRVTQQHGVDPTDQPLAGRQSRVPVEAPPVREVTLQLEPEFAGKRRGVTLKWRLALGSLVQEGEGDCIRVRDPQLWWPSGQGAQPLYHLDVKAVGAAGEDCGRWERKLGLRTIELDRQQDEWGESFRFVVNGRPVFAKGANWIPAHTFVAGLSRKDYERDLKAAAQANMNMVRVWGGGIYESEDFYDLCDELGLLVWQDLMFACTLYPADRPFIESACAEVAHQARRLRHRASLALWCGNNEVFSCNGQELAAEPQKYADYTTLFHDRLPASLRAIDDVTPYWESSPWRGEPATDHLTGEQRGDTHFWDVWHARQPVKDYERYRFRFVSEFGMQSYSSPATNATFCPPRDDNVFGPEMENHQKNRFGNQIILDYVSRLYRFPRGQDALIYLSQLNQAYCMQVGVEHWRRNAPRCMGTLYWQLNDCWPVASWSSIEFNGRWKALHYVARRFFAPALVSAQIMGDEETIIGNYRRSAIHEAHLYTVYDAPSPARGTLRWEVRHLDGRRLLRGRKPVALRPGESVCQHRLELGPVLKRHERSSIYLRIALELAGAAAGEGAASEDTVFLTAPRFLDLPQANTTVVVERETPTQARIVFRSDAFQHRFAFDLPGLVYRASDNYFDLYPDEPKTVVVETDAPHTAASLKRRLTWRSLVDTY